MSKSFPAFKRHPTEPCIYLSIAEGYYIGNHITPTWMVFPIRKSARRIFKRPPFANPSWGFAVVGPNGEEHWCLGIEKATRKRVNQVCEIGEYPKALPIGQLTENNTKLLVSAYKIPDVFIAIKFGGNTIKNKSG